MFGILALVCQQPAAALSRPALFAEDADLIQEHLSIRDVASLARRQQNTQKARRWHCKPHGFGWSGHLGCAPMHGLTVLRAPAPEEAQIGTAVESIIKEARSVSPSDSGKCADAQALA